MSAIAICKGRYLIAAASLQLQHQVIKRLYEDRLVLAPIDLTQPLFILDCGTGAGKFGRTPLTSIPPCHPCRTRH